jgi:hypothetical protein
MKIVKSKLKDLPQRNVLTSSSKELELLQKIEEKLNIKI